MNQSTGLTAMARIDESRYGPTTRADDFDFLYASAKTIAMNNAGIRLYD
jgi:hypothetical protein